MQIIACDKCHEQIRTFPDQPVHFPIVEMRVISNMYEENHGESRRVDLCSDCQKKVYDFIFSNEVNNCR